MEEVLSEVETHKAVSNFSALLLKCTPDGRISQVLHSDFEDELFIPEGEHFSDLFSGLWMVNATDFIANLSANGRACTDLVTDRAAKPLCFRFDGTYTGNCVLINGHQITSAEVKPLQPDGTKNHASSHQICLDKSPNLATIGSYEIITGTDEWLVSQQMYSLFGWEPEEVFTNKTYLAIVHPDDVQPMLARMETCLKAGTNFQMLYRAKHRNGNWLQINSTGRAELDGNGKITRVIGAKQDISAHYSMQKALLETEELYRSVIDSALDAIVVINDTGIISDWNPQATQLFGRAKSEALGTDLRQLLKLELPISGRTPQKAKAARQILGKRLEVTALRNDGSEFLAEVTINKATIKGRPCFSVFIRNISDRRQTENLLLEKKKQLKEISTSIPGVVFQFRRSQSGRYFFTYISSRVTKYAGVTVDECYSDIETVLSKLHPSDLGPLKFAIERSAANVSSLLQVCRVFHFGSGEIIHLQLHAVPSRHENGDIVWNGTIIDVTETAKAELKLKTSEKHYRQLLETITEGVVVADREDNVLFSNKQFCRLTGYTPKELEGSNFRQLLVAFEEDRRIIAEQSLDRWKGKSQNYDVRIRTKHDQLLWVRVNAAPVRDENGHITGAIATLLDITKEKKAKEEIHKSEERYRQLFQSNPHPMFVYDRSTLKILAVNQATRLHYQYTEQEFLEMKRTDLLLEEGVHHFEKVLFYAKGKEKYNHKIQHRKKNGEVIDVQINACLFQYSDHDAVLVIAQDITEQNRAAFALQDSEARYKSLFEQNPEPVFSLDLHGKIQTANKAFAGMLDAEVEDVMGISYFDFLDPECHESCSNWFGKVVNGSAQTFYSVILNKHGSRAVVNMTQMPIKVSNQIVGVYCILKDETEILRVNQELQKSHQELRELASHIHVAREEERKYIAREIHDELGQVLTALKIDISLLTRKANSFQEELSNEINSTLGIADEALKSVKRIVSELRPIGLDQLGLLNEVKLFAQRYQTRFGIQVDVLTPESGVQLDREQALEVFRIIQEALTNVARHSQATAVTINISQEPGSVLVSIADNGIGISSDAKKKEKSFGLIGMRERALMIGGSLQISSEGREGTEVLLILPIIDNTKIIA